MDAEGQHKYKAYVIDGLHDPQTVEFTVLENIATGDVYLKRRGSLPGVLYAGTPVICSANSPPEQVFGVKRGEIIRGRFMVIDCKDILLFPLLNHIREIHNLHRLLLMTKKFRMICDFFL